MRLDRSYDDSLHCATCIAREADMRTARERRDAGDVAGFFRRRMDYVGIELASRTSLRAESRRRA
jgi:hypothetical protein